MLYTMLMKSIFKILSNNSGPNSLEEWSLTLNAFARAQLPQADAEAAVRVWKLQGSGLGDVKVEQSS